MGYLLIDPRQEDLIFSNLDPQQIKDRNFKYISSSIGFSYRFSITIDWFGVCSRLKYKSVINSLQKIIHSDFEDMIGKLK